MTALTYATVFIVVIGIGALVWTARWPHSRDRRLALITGSVMLLVPGALGVLWLIAHALVQARMDAAG